MRKIAASIAVTVMSSIHLLGTATSTPAQPVSGKTYAAKRVLCNQNRFCAHSKRDYKGHSLSAMSTSGCLNTGEWTAHSVENNTRYYVNLYPKANCKGGFSTMNWGTEISWVNPGFRSFRRG
ncbi:peptidase inhibitor family I36 protein [Streptomyces malaysiensis]|uniref:peptidase inhibitor family I36 protein n=2 Tax=Streptomyces malaysiensis TaxID=92644 RepID=UPI00099FA7E5